MAEIQLAHEVGNLGLLTLNHVRDEREVQEGSIHHVELFEAREDTAVAFEPSKQTFDLVAPFVHCPVIVPFDQLIGLGWDHRFQFEV